MPEMIVSRRRRHRSARIDGAPTGAASGRERVWLNIAFISSWHSRKTTDQPTTPQGWQEGSGRASSLSWGNPDVRVRGVDLDLCLEPLERRRLRLGEHLHRCLRAVGRADLPHLAVSSLADVLDEFPETQAH